MSDIVFLTLEDVLALHDDAIAFAGGETGVLSIDLLQSAIAQPEAGFGGQWANPADAAAEARSFLSDALRR